MTTFSTKGYAATQEQVAELFTILSIMRPHQSRMEAKFAKEFLAPLKPKMDGMGNFIVRIGDAPVLWSCHIDTVHTYGGIAPLEINEQGVIHVPKYSLASCLGADDGAGVWLMLQMIRAERPGLYVFHRGEERGCIGSRYIAKTTPKLLDGIEYAIAFDRRGMDSIITHQCGQRCCSEEFSASMATQLGMKYKSDSTGMYTDTAQYVDLVGECTNLSVGYYSQHGRTEEQDLPFILDLHQRVLELDPRDFVSKRKPGEKESKWGNGYGGYGSYGRRHNSGWEGSLDGSDDAYESWNYGEGEKVPYWKSEKYQFLDGKKWDAASNGYIWPGKEWDATKKEWMASGAGEKVREYMDARSDIVIFREKRTIGQYSTVITTVPENYLMLVKDYPEEIAAVLADKKYGLDYLHSQIRKHGGVCKTIYKKVSKGGTA